MVQKAPFAHCASWDRIVRALFPYHRTSCLRSSRRLSFTDITFMPGGQFTLLQSPFCTGSCNSFTPSWGTLRIRFGFADASSLSPSSSISFNTTGLLNVRENHDWSRVFGKFYTPLQVQV